MKNRINGEEQAQIDLGLVRISSSFIEQKEKKN